jgi:hypothetical protein
MSGWQPLPGWAEVDEEDDAVEVAAEFIAAVYRPVLPAKTQREAAGGSNNQPTGPPCGKHPKATLNKRRNSAACRALIA